MSRSIKSKPIPDELKGYPLFEDFDAALAATKPDAVSINSWPNTHAEYAIKAMNAGAHVFMEKPIATNIEDAEAVVQAARGEEQEARARLHPARPSELDEVHRTRPDARQAAGDAAQPQPAEQRPGLDWHKNLIDSLIPIVDCGVHYVDVMCQMTGAKPVRVHGIGASLWAEADKPNYGHLHVDLR